MAADGFTFYYGSYVHPKGEVYPRVIEAVPMPNEDGVRWATMYRMEVAGDFCSNGGLTVQQITTRTSEMESAYRNDYKDCGFKDPDGNLTPHHITNNDIYNLSGNKIVRRSWDNMGPEEYANTRSFSITIAALFKESYSEIIGFKEATTKIGTGGPVWKMYNLWDGTPYKEIIHNTSKVVHVQSGTIIGLSTWPDPLIYSPPYWPSEEQEWRRAITYHSPKFHGFPGYAKGTHYQVDYTYYFERPSASAVNLRFGFN